MAMMESKYYASACYDREFRSLHHSTAIDDWSKVEEFVWKYVQQGLNCLIIEHETGEKKYAYAEDFNENTVEPNEVIRGTTKHWRKFVDEEGNVFDLNELREFFDTNREEISLNSGAETFEEYLRNCLSKNGNLTEMGRN